MSIFSILFRSPERVFADYLSSKEFPVQCEPFTQESINPPEVMKKYYEQNSLIGKSLFLQPTNVRTFITKDGSVLHTKFKGSNRQTHYHLIDKSFVVSPLVKKCSIRTPAQYGQVNHDDKLKVMHYFPQTSKKTMATPPPIHPVVIDTVTKIHALMKRNLVILWIATFVALQTVRGLHAYSFVPELFMTTARIVYRLVFAVAIVRLVQTYFLNKQVTSITNFADLVGQVRRWAYRYPNFCQKHPHVQRFLSADEIQFLTKTGAPSTAPDIATEVRKKWSEKYPSPSV